MIQHGEPTKGRSVGSAELAGWRGRGAPWERLTVLVAGLGRSGFVAADLLAELGATVIAVDDRDPGQVEESATMLDILGVQVRVGPGSTDRLPAPVDLVVVSPGWRPDHRLLVAANAAGIPIWGEPELARRLSTVPWLAVTGTNGKTTTTQLLASILASAGLRTAAVGNIGAPISETILDAQTFDVLAVELSSFQLHHSIDLAPHSAAVLNLRADHLDWHGSEQAYADAKAKIYQSVEHSCVYNVADSRTEQMVEQAEVIEGARAIGFTLGVPAPSMIGIVDDLLVDRAFVADRRNSAVELAKVGDLASQGEHNLANALAAAALARSFGVPPTAVQQGLTAVEPLPHRMQALPEAGGLQWVNDSKATNPAAAEASLTAFDSVVWVAGGQAKGADFDELVRRQGSRIRAAVLIGVDREKIAASLARHAPQIPVQLVSGTDSGVMAQAVRHAAELGQPSDVVLLAPGCASQDIWVDYADRGDAFAAGVRQLFEVPSRAEKNPPILDEHAPNLDENP